MIVGDTLGDAQALHGSFSDTLAEVETDTLVDTPGDSQELVDTLADTPAEVEAVTPDDTPDDAQALVDTLVEVESETVGDHGGMRRLWFRLSRSR